MRRFYFLTFIALWPMLASAGETPVAPRAPAAESVVVENTRAEKTLTLSAADLARLPRAEVKVEVDKQHRTYSGVPLAELLHAAGVEWGGKCSPLLTCVVVIEAADGYSVLFSIPEIDPGQRHRMVILADQVDGKPLPKGDGPFQTIEEDAKQHGRWVKQAQKISLVLAIRKRPRAK
jgi:hypothetical protein